jgi:hypothetical protein
MEGRPGPRESPCSFDKHESAIMPSEGKTKALEEIGEKIIGK